VSILLRFFCKAFVGALIRCSRTTRLRFVDVQTRRFKCDGTIRFYGERVDVEGEIRVGVELDDPLGLNNGTAQGHTCVASHACGDTLVLPS
jgi:hypothetical protein